MKHLLLVLVLLVSSVTASYAQYAYPQEISSRGGKIVVDGEKLAPHQGAELLTAFGGEQMGNNYLKNRKGYKTGTVLAVTGSSMIVLGTFTSVAGFVAAFETDMEYMPDVLLNAGRFMAISGTVIALIGIPKAIVHKSRIRRIVKDYNSGISSKTAVTFTPARSGLGIAMNF